MNDDDTSFPPTDPQFAPNRDDYNTNLRIEPALERRHEIGLFTAIFETIQQILFSPAQTAAHLRLEGWRLPTVFLAITSLIASTLLSALMYGVMFLTFRISGALTPPEVSDQLSALTFSSGILMGFVLTLVFATLLALCAHGTLVLLKGVSHPFVSTYRWTAYCMAATSVATLVPICGVYIAGGWFLVVWTIGLQHLHSTNTTRAVVAMMVSLAIYVTIYVSYLLLMTWATGDLDQILESFKTAGG